METKELQSKIDVTKWLESERQHQDLCGSYFYCTECDKAISFPCATAYLKTESEKMGTNNPSNKKDAKPSLSFSDKLGEADPQVKAAYAMIRATLCDKGLHSRITKRSDNYTFKRVPYAKVRMLSKGLQLFLALDPNTEEFAKFPHKDASEKASCKDTPFVFKVSSPLSVKRAIMLINAIEVK